MTDNLPILMNTFGRRLSTLTTARGTSSPVRVVRSIWAATVRATPAATAPFARCSLSRFLSHYRHCHPRACPGDPVPRTQHRHNPSIAPSWAQNKPQLTNARGGSPPPRAPWWHPLPAGARFLGFYTTTDTVILGLDPGIQCQELNTGTMQASRLPCPNLPTTNLGRHEHRGRD